MNRISNYLSVIFNSLKKRGPTQTILYIVGEYWFDIKFRVNTRPHLLNGDPSIIGDHLLNAEPYYGTNWFVLKKTFQYLIGNDLVNPASAHMIDFGCGAGRALMAAQYFGIAKVTGVEFSKKLCLRAEDNLWKFTRLRIKNSDSLWAVVHADAGLFPIPQDATLFFLYNPFGRPVIDAVAKHILEFARLAEYTVIVVYVNPIHNLIFEQLGFVRLPESSLEVAIYAGR